MYGNLFIYDPKFKLVAFESGSLSSSQCLILLGDLTDDLLSLPYVERLSSKLESLSKTLFINSTIITFIKSSIWLAYDR